MNYELWKQGAEGIPEFIGYQRATNLIEAVANKFGHDNVDRNEDGSFKLTDKGYPSVKGEIVYMSKDDVPKPIGSADNSGQQSGEVGSGSTSGITGQNAGSGDTGKSGENEGEGSGITGNQSGTGSNVEGKPGSGTDLASETGNSFRYPVRSVTDETAKDIPENSGTSEDSFRADTNDHTGPQDASVGKVDGGAEKGVGNNAGNIGDTRGEDGQSGMSVDLGAKGTEALNSGDSVSIQKEEDGSKLEKKLRGNETDRPERIK